RCFARQPAPRGRWRARPRTRASRHDGRSVGGSWKILLGKIAVVAWRIVYLFLIRVGPHPHALIRSRSSLGRRRFFDPRGAPPPRAGPLAYRWAGWSEGGVGKLENSLEPAEGVSAFWPSRARLSCPAAFEPLFVM